VPLTANTFVNFNPEKSHLDAGSGSRIKICITNFLTEAKFGGGGPQEGEPPAPEVMGREGPDENRRPLTVPTVVRPFDRP